MPELIDRHALLKKVYEHPQERERMTDGEWCRKCIYEAPKVESEPVRHGRWDNNGTGSRIFPYLCTACNESNDYPYPYCPICGARMDGGADNG